MFYEETKLVLFISSEVQMLLAIAKRLQIYPPCMLSRDTCKIGSMALRFFVVLPLPSSLLTTPLLTSYNNNNNNTRIK